MGMFFFHQEKKKLRDQASICFCDSAGCVCEEESVSLWIKRSRFTVPSLLSFLNLTGDSIVVAPAGTGR